LSPEDIKRLRDAARAAGDGPSGDTGAASAGTAAPQVSGDIGLSLMQKVELRLDKREGCRKQAQAQGLGLLERIQFVRKCME
jgi:arylsulfatase